MSDEQKRIEELEQQLKIAKLEKELAEMKSEKLENQKNVANKETLSIEEVVKNYINQKILKTDCILVGDKLTTDIITKSGMKFDNDEKPLLLLYKKSLFYDFKTRILITDKNIYYKALPDAFLIGLTCNFAKKIEGKFNLQNLKCLEIGEHDHAIGSAYVGHQLKVNNDVVGLIRMGTDIEYDEEAINYLNGLFSCMSNNEAVDTQIDTRKQINTTKKERTQDNVSDSGWTIVWKLGLAVIGAAIMIVLFPNMFSDKIVVTNAITGEEIEFPVETIEDEYCVKMSIFEGKEHCFCSADKENLTKFVTHVKQSEIKEEAKMGLDGAMGGSIARFYQMDAIIYGSAKIQYKIHERDLETSQKGSADTGSEYAQNSAEGGAIEDEYERTYVFHGINISYNPALSKENEVRKAAKQCYEDGNTTEEDLNQCIGLKLRWF